MKKQLFIISFVLLFFKPSSSFSTTGCLVPGYTELLIVQTPPGGIIYSSIPNLQPLAGCWWVLETTISGCLGHGKVGVKGEYKMECPFDDYIPLLMIAIGGFGYVKLLSRKHIRL